jgi:hypothetical protein
MAEIEIARKVVEAWEALPGGRNYSMKVVESWLTVHMAPMVNEMRSLIDAGTSSAPADQALSIAPHDGNDTLSVSGGSGGGQTDQLEASGFSAHLISCPCTTFEQGDECPIDMPSLLCTACDGKGIAPIDKVVALAAEMMKIADQVGELEDPFAAWESISLVQSQNGQFRKALDKISGMIEDENADLDEAIETATYVIRHAKADSIASEGKS